MSTLALNEVVLTFEDECLLRANWWVRRVSESPSLAVAFERGAQRLWLCALGWAVADVVGGRNVNHRYYGSIGEAINAEGRDVFFFV